MADAEDAGGLEAGKTGHYNQSEHDRASTKQPPSTTDISASRQRSIKYRRFALYAQQLPELPSFEDALPTSNPVVPRRDSLSSKVSGVVGASDALKAEYSSQSRPTLGSIATGTVGQDRNDDRSDTRADNTEKSSPSRHSPRKPSITIPSSPISPRWDSLADAENFAVQKKHASEDEAGASEQDLSLVSSHLGSEASPLKPNSAPGDAADRAETSYPAAAGAGNASVVRDTDNSKQSVAVYPDTTSAPADANIGEAIFSKDVEDSAFALVKPLASPILSPFPLSPTDSIASPNPSTFSEASKYSQSTRSRKSSNYSKSSRPSVSEPDHDIGYSPKKPWTPTKSPRRKNGEMSIENFSRPRRPSIKQPLPDPAHQYHVLVEYPPHIPEPAFDDAALKFSWPRARGVSVSSAKSFAIVTDVPQQQLPSAPMSAGLYDTRTQTQSPPLVPAPLKVRRSTQSFQTRNSTSSSHGSQLGGPWAAAENRRSNERTQGTLLATTRLQPTERTSVLTKGSSVRSYRTDEPSVEDVMGLYERGFVDDSDLEEAHPQQEAQLHYPPMAINTFSQQAYAPIPPEQHPTPHPPRSFLDLSRPESASSEYSLREASIPPLATPIATTRMSIPDPPRPRSDDDLPRFDATPIANRRMSIPQAQPGEDDLPRFDATPTATAPIPIPEPPRPRSDDHVPRFDARPYSTSVPKDVAMGPMGALRRNSELRDSAKSMGYDASIRTDSKASAQLSSASFDLEDPDARDRYGFKKANQHVTRERYDDWNEGYTEYLGRRKKKWDVFMKECNLPTHNPIRFPLPGSKTKRFIRKGIPPEWRGAAWFYYAQGPSILARHVGLYYQLVQQRASDSDIDMIERDLYRTFPDNIRFRPMSSADVDESMGLPPVEPEIITSLRRVLQAFSIYNPKIGYCQSLNFIAGLLLLFVESEEQVFWLLNVITRYLLPGTHDDSLEGSQIDLAVLMAVLHDSMPQLWTKLTGEDSMDVPGTRPSTARSVKKSMMRKPGRQPVGGRLPPITLTMTSWFMSCYIGTLPIETVLRVWDVFFYEGSRTMFRIALAILKQGEDEIMAVSDPMEMFSVVQSMPRRMLDANELMEACFRRRNGFGHLSQGTVDDQRKERRERAELERRRIAGGETGEIKRKGTMFRRKKKDAVAVQAIA